VRIETVGKAFLSGFGDKAMVGFLMGVLDRVSPGRCYEYIRDDMELLHWATEAQWARYRAWARKARLKNSMQEVDRERINAELRKFHPELWQVIHDTPGGPAWFDRQIEQMRQKLGLT